MDLSERRRAGDQDGGELDNHGGREKRAPDRDGERDASDEIGGGGGHGVSGYRVTRQGRRKAGRTGR